MRVMIDALGQHEPDLHLMIVDNNALLLDLDGLRHSAIDPGSLTDPTVARVTWGPVVRNGSMTEAGEITLVDGTRRTFFDKQLLKPYLAAFEARRAEVEREQADYDNTHSA